MSVIGFILRLVSLPIWRVVSEVVEGSSFQYPVEVVEAVLEASEVGQSGGVVGGVLEDVHGPRTATGEVGVPGAGNVAPTVINSCCWLFVHADASVPVHETDIAVIGCIACLNAPEIDRYPIK